MNMNFKNVLSPSPTQSATTYSATRTSSRVPPSASLALFLAEVVSHLSSFDTALYRNIRLMSDSYTGNYDVPTKELKVTLTPSSADPQLSEFLAKYGVSITVTPLST